MNLFINNRKARSVTLKLDEPCECEHRGESTGKIDFSTFSTLLHFAIQQCASLFSPSHVGSSCGRVATTCEKVSCPPLYSPLHFLSSRLPLQHVKIYDNDDLTFACVVVNGRNSHYEFDFFPSALLFSWTAQQCAKWGWRKSIFLFTFCCCCSWHFFLSSLLVCKHDVDIRTHESMKVFFFIHHKRKSIFLISSLGGVEKKKCV